MSLVACQRDARLRALDCVALSWSPLDDGRYAVILDDTVLYPEGGGQPADHGRINGVAVVDVQRGQSGVVHTVLGPGAPGPVRVELDWARRFDHMQQHSAQHLLTALAADHLDRPTVAFHLGEETCTIDLLGPPLDEAARARLEDLANAEIRSARPLRVREVDAQTYDRLPVRSRGLPEGHTGPIRLVEIEGLDLNTCGGTHVAHTGELQVVALLRVEALKGGSRLHYLAGDRVRRRLAEALQREAALTALLTAPPDTHADGWPACWPMPRPTPRPARPPSESWPRCWAPLWPPAPAGPATCTARALIWASCRPSPTPP